MPELPEVETLKRELARAVIGKKIRAVCVYHPAVIRAPSAEQFKSGLAGVSLQGVERRGKLLMFALSNGKFLTVHLKMTGQLIYPGTGKAGRLSFLFSDGTAMDFNDQRLFAEARLVDDVGSLKFLRQLGPEPFDLDAKRFCAMLAGKKAKIKPLLMDQTFISGVGNLYAAEALFAAGIHPGRPASSLTDAEKAELLKAVKDVLARAIRQGGSSVDEYVRLSGKQGGFVKYLKVYDRANKPCSVCRTPIKRISLGGRGTYFCPHCQKEK